MCSGRLKPLVVRDNLLRACGSVAAPWLRPICREGHMPYPDSRDDLALLVLGGMVLMGCLLAMPGGGLAWLFLT